MYSELKKEPEKRMVTSKYSVRNFILLLIMVIIPQLYSQTLSGRISGQVLDQSSGEYIFGAGVALYKDSTHTKLIKGTITSKIGTFSFPDLIRGKYYISVQFIGYKSESLQLSIDEKSINPFSKISMKTLQTTLSDVVIQGNRDSNFTISAISLSPQMMSMLPSRGGETDIFGSLTLVPGVTTSSEMSSGLYVRGGSPDQTLTLIDGVMLYNPFHLGGFASTFNSDAVKDVKLIKGAFPAEYGGRLSSVLDITLKEGSREKTTQTIALGSIGSWVAVEGPVSAKATYLLSGRVNYLSALQEVANPESILPRYNFYDLNGKCSYYISDYDKATISGFYSADYLASPHSSKDANYDVNWNNAVINLNWLHLQKDSRFTKATISVTNYNYNTLIRNSINSLYHQDFFASSAITDLGLKVDRQYFSSAEHNVKNGVEIVYHNFSIANNNYYTDALKTDERAKRKFNSIEASIYLQDEWSISPIISLNSGVRVYGFPQSNYVSVEPRISAAFQISDVSMLKAAFAMGNQFLHLLTRNDIVMPSDIWFPSTALLKPENISQFGLSYESWLFAPEYFFTIETYYSTTRNLYEYSDAAIFSAGRPIEEQLAQGKGDAYGAEFFLRKESGSIQGWIGYTLAWTNRYFDGINKGQKFYPRYDRRHNVNFVVTYSLSENISFGATWVYGTGQAYTMPTGLYSFPIEFIDLNATPHQNIYLDYSEVNKYRLPAYHKLDLSCTYKFVYGEIPFSLSLNIYNAYNNSNALARYLSFNYDSATKKDIPVLKQLTLFPVLPTLTISTKF